MPNLFVGALPIVIAVMSSSWLLYQRFYTDDGLRLIVAGMVLFCLSYDGYGKTSWSIGKLILLIFAMVFANILPDHLAIALFLASYLVIVATRLNEKRFANFFGPIILLVASLVAIIPGVRSEIFGSTSIVWVTLLLSLFASGRSSLAMLVTLAPFLANAISKSGLGPIHYEVSVIFVVWCYFEVLHGSLRRLAIATTALALWLSPQHPWVMISLLANCLPVLNFINGKVINLVTIMLALSVTLNASYSSSALLLTTILFFITLKKITMNSESVRQK